MRFTRNMAKNIPLLLKVSQERVNQTVVKVIHSLTIYFKRISLQKLSTVTWIKSDEETYVDCEEETETFYEMEEDETFFDCEEHNINKCEFRESLASWNLNLNLEQ